ncbi:MAG TPA: hypothetical protein VIW19_01005, partial [Gaiellaceae bacterium]
MDAAAERRQHAEAPVADLVAEALDDDGSVRRNGARRRLLLTEKGEQVLGRAFVERVLGLEPLDRLFIGERRQLARGRADRLAQLVGAADAFALPERHRAR